MLSSRVQFQPRSFKWEDVLIQFDEVFL
jgi:hypothetical protein